MTQTPLPSVPVGVEQGNAEFRSRPRDDERPTRKPLGFWDRIKLVLLFAGAWLVLFWAALAQFDPAISTREAFNQTMRSYWWLIALAVLEIVRQIHYYVSEHSARWHQRWTRQFTRIERRTGKMNDWTRYRISRLMKVLFLLLIVDLALAKIYHLPAATALIQLPVTFIKALPFIWQLAFSFFFIIFQFVGLFWFLSRGGIDVYMPDDIKTRFSDVWGQDIVATKIKENMLFLEAPESIEEKGGYVPGGILLWGPPGTGKTLMAEAVAGETGKPFVFVDPGAFIQMFFGVGILKVKGLFRKLRKLAVRYGGVIVFFDEADSLGSRSMPAAGGGALGGAGKEAWRSMRGCNGMSYLSPYTASMLFQEQLRRSVAEDTDGGRIRDHVIAGMGMGGGGGMGTLQALLTELSGLKKPRGFLNRIVRRVLGMRPKSPPKYRILVMMATNMPEALDPALLRPGRIDRIYKVGFPSKDGRRRTFEGYLAKVSHSLNEAEIEKLATITQYSTGATIKDMVNEALIHAIRSGRRTIEWRDVMEARRQKELGLPEGLQYSERERHATAVHEACHAVAAFRMRHHMTIDLATIEGRANFLGLVSSVKPEDEFSTWKSEYEADMMVSLASLAGERLFFDGDSTNGVIADLQSATHVAIQMEGYVGMGSTIASHGAIRSQGIGGPGGGAEDANKQELLRGSLGERIERLLRQQYKEAGDLLAENRRQVLSLAHALETHKTLDGEDVEAILEGRRGPLIDGRVYLDPAFMASIESYHDETVRAHRRHGKAETKLPPLIPAAVDGTGNGEAPARPDVSGNGETHHPHAAAEAEPES